jgi:hypothetical protein
MLGWAESAASPRGCYSPLDCDLGSEGLCRRARCALSWKGIKLLVTISDVSSALLRPREKTRSRLDR